MPRGRHDFAYAPVAHGGLGRFSCRFAVVAESRGSQMNFLVIGGIKPASSGKARVNGLSRAQQQQHDPSFLTAPAIQSGLIVGHGFSSQQRQAKKSVLKQRQTYEADATKRFTNTISELEATMHSKAMHGSSMHHKGHSIFRLAVDPTAFDAEAMAGGMGGSHVPTAHENSRALTHAAPSHYLEEDFLRALVGTEDIESDMLEKLLALASQMKTMFEEADRDSDGQITRSQMKAIFERMGDALLIEADNVWSEDDLAIDGLIDFKGFIDIFLHLALKVEFDTLMLARSGVHAPKNDVGRKSDFLYHGRPSRAVGRPTSGSVVLPTSVFSGLAAGQKRSPVRDNSARSRGNQQWTPGLDTRTMAATKLPVVSF